MSRRAHNPEIGCSTQQALPFRRNMIIKGLENIRRHLESVAYKGMPVPGGTNIVSDDDEDYVFDALYDVPNR